MRWVNEKVELRAELAVLRAFVRQIEESAKAAEAGEARRVASGTSKKTQWPSALKELGARAVYHEIDALVEHELQLTVLPLWEEFNDQRFFNNRKIRARVRAWVADQTGTVRFPEILARNVSDETYALLKALVEGHYGKKLETLPGGHKMRWLHAVVIDLKHRKGFADQRRSGHEHRTIHTLTLDHAREAINKAGPFVRALWKLRASRHPRKPG